MYDGIDPMFKEIENAEKYVEKRLRINKPYIFYCGNMMPHKNLKILIKAYSALSDDLKKYAQIGHVPLKKESKDDSKPAPSEEDLPLVNMVKGISNSIVGAFTGKGEFFSDKAQLRKNEVEEIKNKALGSTEKVWEMFKKAHLFETW